MFFSIIVPIYKVEKYLKECIDSILAQTFTDYELILVDDGSPDKSGEICEEYSKKDSRIIVIHKKNGGLSDARNCGTRAASGQYIIYIDSDDYLLTNDFLQKVFKTTKNGADIVLYKYKKYYEESKTFADVGFHLPQIEENETKAQVIKKLVEMDAFYCAAWMKAIKLSLIKENNIEFKVGIFSEDQEWYYHVILAASKIAAIDEAFIAYRQRLGSITATTGKKNIYDNVSLLKYWNDRISSETIPKEEKYAILNSLGKLYSNLLISYATLNVSDKKECSKKMRELAPLLNYRLNSRTKRMSMIYKAVGFYGTVQILTIIHRIRRRK